MMIKFNEKKKGKRFKKKNKNFKKKGKKFKKKLTILNSGGVVLSDSILLLCLVLTVRVDRGPAYTPVPLDPAQAPGDGTHFVWSKRRYCLLLSYCRHPHQHCLASLESKILVCVLPSYTFLFVNCTCLSK